MLRQLVSLPRIIIALSVFLLSGASDAFACRLDVPFNIKGIDAADVIFQGQIVTYELVEEGYKTVAKMTFEVSETFKGDPSVLSKGVVWGGGISHGVVKDFTKLQGKDFIVGVAKPPQSRDSQNPDPLNLYWVVQEACAAPFMFQYVNGHLVDAKDSDFPDSAALGHFPGVAAKVEQALRSRGMLR